MADTSGGLRSAFERVDFLLALAGLLGAIVYFTVLPGQNLDGAARGHISRADAVSTARTFASESSGFPMDEMEPDAVIRRNGPLLDTLQERHGRRRAREMAVRDSIPVHHWQIRWSRPTGDDEDEDVGDVTLTLQGQPLGYRINHATLIQRRAHHIDALQEVLGDDLSADSLVADSLILRRLAFRIDTDYVRPAGEAPESANQRIYLDSSDVVTIARYHLAQSALKGLSGSLDSIRTAGHEGVITATAYFSKEDSTAGGWSSASVEVLPTGSLVRLDSRLVREEEDDGFDTGEMFELLQPIFYAILSLLIIVIFFRRLTSRLVDTRMALRDGIVFGLAAGIAMSGGDFGELPDNSVVAAVVLMLLVLVGSVGAGVLVFFISGGVCSVARDVWSQKLQSFDLVHKGAVRNVPVGQALLRGTLIGFITVGVFGAALLGLPENRINVASEEVFYTASFPGITFLHLFSSNLFQAFYLALAGVLLTAVLVRKRTAAAPVVLGVTTALLSLLQISPIELTPLGGEIAISALLGLAVAWVLWRFDVMTTLTAIFAVMALWRALEGFTVTSTPEFIDSILMLAMISGIGVLGFIGVASGKTSSEIPVVVPEYIADLAQRERLDREFELAREVQLSFLPAKTPDLAGIDIASVCLPSTEVGGDYYDFFSVDGHKLGIVVGDVSGKGMQAAFYMTLMKGILHTLVQQTHAPATILSKANELFRMNASRGTFMSMIFGVLDPEAGTLQFARAGHNPAIICRAGSPGPQTLKPHGAAIGLAPGRLFESSIEEITLTLYSGDVLVVYTDGITEAMNMRRELYDEERLMNVVSQCRGKSASDLLSSIITDVEDFAGFAPRHDDMTLMVIRKA